MENIKTNNIIICLLVLIVVLQISIVAYALNI